METNIAIALLRKYNGPYSTFVSSINEVIMTFAIKIRKNPPKKTIRISTKNISLSSTRVFRGVFSFSIIDPFFFIVE